jgi:CHAD domain-containing protein
MTPVPVRYSFDDLVAARQAFQTVTERLESRTPSTCARSETFYDSFDWRLFKAGLALVAQRGTTGTYLALTDLDGSVRHRLRYRGEPGFAWDLPHSPLREAIAPMIEIRRLLPMLVLESSGRQLNLLDERSKTVARLRLEESAVVRTDPADQDLRLHPSLTAMPVRGYDMDFQRLTHTLERELGLLPAPESELLDLARQAGLNPGKYSSKLNLKLDPDQPAAEALRSIYRRLLEVMRANEQGVKLDLDSEFLHDFRVAVRRTRSAMTQIKGVLPQSHIDRFRTGFAWLGQITGPSRDLHVYQLKMPDYQSSLPEHDRADLEPLQTFLDSHQVLEHRNMVQSLESDRYASLLQDWQRFLNHPPEVEEAPPDATTPILELASRRIWKSYRRVMKKGSAIDDDSPPEALHRLRIDCKKLRYLLEFFYSLYEETEIGKLIKALKQLQDNLGDFNDLTVQQEKLHEFGNTMLVEKSGPASTLMVMGRLIANFEQRQEDERRAFHTRFDEFSSRQNRQRFRELFRIEGASSA